MPAERTVFESTKRKTGRRSKKVGPVACPTCAKMISRPSDLARHLKTHDTNAERFICPSEGCNYDTLQKSNMETHKLRHTDTRPYICKDDPQCRYDTNDPALLLRHRKKQHNYQPSRRKPGNSSASQALSPPLPSSGTSTSGVEVPMPNFFPVAGTSSHLPPMQPSLHYHWQEGPSYSGNPPPWDGIGFWAAEPQMNGSYGCQWSGPADPTPTMHGNESDMQINYRDATEFQDSRINHGSTSSYTLPSYYSPPDVAFPSQFFDNSADQSHYYTSGDYFDPCLWDFASGGRQNF